MRQYTAENLVIHPGSSLDLDVVIEVTPEDAGWDTINFQVRRLLAGRAWSFQTDGHELALVMLGGTVDVDSNRGQWQGVGKEQGGAGVELVDEANYRYLSLQFKDDVLVGATSIGWTDHVGALRGLVQTQAPLGEWKARLLADPTQFMAAYLGTAQKAA